MQESLRRQSKSAMLNYPLISHAARYMPQSRSWVGKSHDLKIRIGQGKAGGQCRELRGSADRIAVGIVNQCPGGAIINDAVIGIMRGGTHKECVGGQRAGRTGGPEIASSIWILSLMVLKSTM